MLETKKGIYLSQATQTLSLSLSLRKQTIITLLPFLAGFVDSPTLKKLSILSIFFVFIICCGGLVVIFMALKFFQK